MTDVMIDIESLDTSPNCVILTIGAVKFDPKGRGIAETLELRPSIEDQVDMYGRSISDATVEWWSRQSKSAIDEALGDHGRQSLADCMEALYKFCWNQRAIWSHGAGFDIVVMESALKQTSGRVNPVPWQYYTTRDTRTLFDVTGVTLKDGGHVTSHKAIEDAIRQAECVQTAYRKLIKAGIVSASK